MSADEFQWLSMLTHKTRVKVYSKLCWQRMSNGEMH